MALPWSRLSLSEAQLLQAAFWTDGCSRHALADRLGFSRSKANSLTANLLEEGLLAEAGLLDSSGGRRPERLQLNGQLGFVVSVDVGATTLNMALLNSDMSVAARHSEAIDVRNGPGAVLTRVRQAMEGMLAQLAVPAKKIIAVGMGVPGPVNFASGQLVNPPLMPGWDSYSIRDYMRDVTPAPIYVDNDVNLMALGALWRHRQAHDNFLVVKVGTGIGCGIVCHGELYRGQTGSAGDVGHICVDQDGPQCHCGNPGCVEVMAAAPAIERAASQAAETGASPALAARMAQAGRIDLEDVAAASRAGDPAAEDIVRRSGNYIGQMLASVVNFFNPSHIFIGGRVASIGPLFLASIRQSVNRRSLALSTRHLEISYAPLGNEAGLIGAGVLAIRESLRNRGVRP